MTIKLSLYTVVTLLIDIVYGVARFMPSYSLTAILLRSCRRLCVYLEARNSSPVSHTSSQ